MVKTAEIEALKRDVFFRLMEMAGRVFVLVADGEGVRIGNRGFLPEEKERGLVIVLTDKMSFKWDDAGIEATLSFQSRRERCFIPSRAVVAVYSPDLGVQLAAGPGEAGAETTKAVGPARDMAPEQAEKTGKVIEVDFRGKR